MKYMVDFMQPNQKIVFKFYTSLAFSAKEKDRFGIVQFCLNIWIVMAHIMLHVEKSLKAVQGQTLGVNYLFQAYLDQFNFKIRL